MYQVSAVRNKGYELAMLSNVAAYGPYYPAYVTGNSATGIDWTDPENAQGVEDADFASCYFFASGNSAPLRGSDFGMAVPSGAVLHGIKVEVLRSADSVGFLDYANSGYGVRLLLDAEDDDSRIGDDLGDEIENWPDNYEWKAYGGPSELWGTSGLTADDLNSYLFAVYVSVITDDIGGTAMVKAMRITVYASTSA